MARRKVFCVCDTVLKDIPGGDGVTGTGEMWDGRLEGKWGASRALHSLALATPWNISHDNSVCFSCIVWARARARELPPPGTSPGPTTIPPYPTFSGRHRLVLSCRPLARVRSSPLHSICIHNGEQALHICFIYAQCQWRLPCFFPQAQGSTWATIAGRSILHPSISSFHLPYGGIPALWVCRQAAWHGLACRASCCPLDDAQPNQLRK